MVVYKPEKNLKEISTMTDPHNSIKWNDDQIYTYVQCN